MKHQHHRRERKASFYSSHGPQPHACVPASFSPSPSFSPISKLFVATHWQSHLQSGWAVVGLRLLNVHSSQT